MYNEIANMLKEKIDHADTVIDVEWLDKLKRAFFEMYDDNTYKENALHQFDVAHEKLLLLKRKREHFSDYVLSLEEEKAYTQAIKVLIKQFKEMK